MDQTKKNRLETGSGSDSDVYQSGCHHPVCVLSERTGYGHIQPLVFEAASAFPLRLNLVPLVHLLEYDSTRDIIWNVAGNSAMFIPSGILLPIVYRQLDRFWKAAAAGAFISLCIEILQLPFSSRASDIDDLILNTLGAAAGYGIYAACKHFKR